jgi:RNA polymerase sigma factor (sigma-70 family)
MRKYANKAMAQLATELSAGLVRLRKGYVDAAEALLQIVKPDREYPYEFVVYRLTGFRGRPVVADDSPLQGKSFRADLQRLMLDVSESFPLRVSDYTERAYDTASLARHFNVSTKTIQRWRKRGLVARRLIFPDGRRRIGFLQHSVEWFSEHRHGQVDRSRRFTQLSDSQREEIIRRAKRMASFTHCTLSEVSRRLARRTGRAMETVRYTIRRHDMEHPDQAVFPDLAPPLGDQEKAVIYRCFLRGVGAQKLADRYGRTRSSIYRVINEMRARQLIGRKISFVYNPQFDRPDADELFLQEPSAQNEHKRAGAKAPKELPPYLRALYDVALLTPEQERMIFARYNYVKYKADKLRKRLDLQRVGTAELKRVEKLLLQANALKNAIVRANLRLVVSIAKKHLGGAQTLFELISDGNVSLMRAVERFDYARGFRFSTYASWAIMRNFARSVPKERYQLDKFSTGNEEVLDVAAGMRTYDPNELNLSELRESIDSLLGELTPRERTILIDHYGLDQEGQTKTLEQLGKQLGLSKERVRQIEIQALRKLRTIVHPREAEFLV